jgi:HEAT repeat protein
MPESLFASASDGAVTAAIWATIASLAASVLLLAYTLELRLQRRWRERRRARIAARWRTVIASAVTGGGAGSTAPLPKLPRRECREFLRLWNYTRNMIEGEAADRLIVLAQALGLPDFVREHAEHADLGLRLASIQALGHLRDADSFARTLRDTDDENPLVSIIAAEALIEIDPARAVEALIPKIAARRDWPRTHVFRMLQKAGSEIVSEPLFRRIRTASNADAAYLLKFAELAEFDVRDAIAADVLRSRTEPELVAAALKSCSGYSEVPGIDGFVSHPAWYVRMQAARVIGRMARTEDAERLEHLLSDSEWWVRYRAARALVRLPALGRAGIDRIRARQHDRYARDILDQAVAELGTSA